MTAAAVIAAEIARAMAWMRYEDELVRYRSLKQRALRLIGLGEPAPVPPFAPRSRTSPAHGGARA